MNNDEELCEADRHAVVEAVMGEPTTRDYPGTPDSWTVLSIDPCVCGCITMPKEERRMDEIAIDAARSI